METADFWQQAFTPTLECHHLDQLQTLWSLDMVE